MESRRVFCYAALCYAALRRHRTATTQVVASEVKLDVTEARRFIGLLCQRGFVVRMAEDVWRSWFLPGEVRVSRASDSSSSSLREEKKEKEREVGRGAQPTLSKQVLLNACGDVRRMSKPWTDQALLGHFIELWEEYYGIGYKPTSSLQADLLSTRQLLDAEGELAVWCVSALFDAALGWVNNKTLSFLSRQDLLAKHVRPAAVSIRRASGYTSGTSTVGLVAKVHMPGDANGR